MEELIFNFCNIEEQNFFLKHLNKNLRVLEWGSGKSTINIGPRVKELVSIEHEEVWFNQTRPALTENVKYFHVPRNSQEAPGHDGTYDNFANYVTRPLQDDIKQLGKFDLIFIDGRARVECAKICQQLGHENTLVFIHDYNHPEEQYRRNEYFEAENYLERIEGVFALYMFKIKNVQSNNNNSQQVKEEETNTEKDCWNSPSVYEHMVLAYHDHRKNQNSIPHVSVFKKQVKELKKDKKISFIIDLGCGTGLWSEFLSDFNYLGVDLKHIIENVSKKLYPKQNFSYFDLTGENENFGVFKLYDAVILNGVIDVMERPLEILDKILANSSRYVLIHRQEISESNPTNLTKRDSYGGFTYHSSINRLDLKVLLKKHNFTVISELECGFANWENGGSSLLLKKND